MSDTDITQQQLKSLLTYCQDTGEFTWKINSRNKRNKGQIAGCVRKGLNAYRIIMIDKVSHYAHRLVWLYITGKFPENEIDHINGNKSDNRFANLRDVRTIENHRNRKRPIDNTSGCVGVNWHKTNKAWQAKITVNGKTLFLGMFKDKLSAVNARKNAETKYGFHINHGR